MTTLLLIVAAFLVITTLLQRPMKKQAQQQAQMRNAVEPGSRVMLTSGLFGTISQTGTDQVVVELAPGVQVTAMKSAIAKVVGPEDEEFEFDDAQHDVVEDGGTLTVADQAQSSDRGVDAFSRGPVDGLAAQASGADDVATGATTSSGGASAAPAPVREVSAAGTAHQLDDEQEPSGDAATMTNAEPGTEQGLGYPEQPGR